jgi:hypothetical protein
MKQKEYLAKKYEAEQVGFVISLFTYLMVM